MNPERSTGAGEPPDTKNDLVRVSFPAKLIAKAQELGKPALLELQAQPSPVPTAAPTRTAA